jgi:hypothetical protein
MYCRQRRHLYYGGQIYKYYLAPSTGPYIAERTKKAVTVYCEMLMEQRHFTFLKKVFWIGAFLEFYIHARVI